MTKSPLARKAANIARQAHSLQRRLDYLTSAIEELEQLNRVLGKELAHARAHTVVLSQHDVMAAKLESELLAEQLEHPSGVETTDPRD
jgi:uncharacterized protein YigA (DUF484 family)